MKTYSNIQMKRAETWINFCVQKQEVPNYILEGTVGNEQLEQQLLLDDDIQNR